MKKSMLIAVSRLAFLAANVLVLFVIEQKYSAESANLLLQVAAIGSLVGALTSLGSNSYLPKRLIEESRGVSELALTFLLAFRALGSSLIILACYVVVGGGAFEGAFLGGVLIVALSQLATTIDFFVERDDNIYTFSKIKLFVVAGLSPIKVFALFSLSAEHFSVVFLADGFLAAVIYVVSMISKRDRAVSLETIAAGKAVAIECVLKSWLVWLSSVLQIGWSRLLFVLLSMHAPPQMSNTFFILIRIVEALAFLPNSISSQYFSQIVAEYKEQGRLGDWFQVYQRRHRVVSLVASFAAIIASVLYIRSIGSEVDLLVYVCLVVSSFLFYTRTSLSRFIVLADLMKFSPVSYVAGVIVSLLGWYCLSPVGAIDIYFVYLLQQVGNFFFVAFFWSSFKEYFASLFRY